MRSTDTWAILAPTIVAVALLVWLKVRAVRERDRVVAAPTGPCRRCGRPTATMHGDLVHVDDRGLFVAVEHRPLPVDRYGPHPAAGVDLTTAGPVALVEPDEAVTISPAQVEGAGYRFPLHFAPDTDQVRDADRRLIDWDRVVSVDPPVPNRSVPRFRALKGGRA